MFDSALFEAVPDNAQEAIEAHAMKGVYKSFITKLDEFYGEWIEANPGQKYGIPVTGEGRAFAKAKPDTVYQGIYNVLKNNEDLKKDWRVFRHTENKVEAIWIAHL